MSSQHYSFLKDNIFNNFQKPNTKLMHSVIQYFPRAKAAVVVGKNQITGIKKTHTQQGSYLPFKINI